MNPLVYAAIEERKFDAMAQHLGYKRISTFYSDLSIAECFGKSAIRDTFNNVCNSWIKDYKMFTEFILSLNWKIWEFCDSNESLAKIYNTLWTKAENLFFEHYEGNEEVMQYYYSVTD